MYKHLVSSPECRKVFDDSWFSVIRCARFFKQLQVLEPVYIRTRDPVLCKQKENVVSLTLFKYYTRTITFIHTVSHSSATTFLTYTIFTHCKGANFAFRTC